MSEPRVIAVFEEDGKSWREMYEELLQNGIKDMVKFEVTTLSDDEVAVKPHIRHKPRKPKKAVADVDVPNAIPDEANGHSAQLGSDFKAAQELIDQGLEDVKQGKVSAIPLEELDGVTLWYCEGCGKVTDKYPCRECGFPEKGGE